MLISFLFAIELSGCGLNVGSDNYQIEWFDGYLRSDYWALNKDTHRLLDGLLEKSTDEITQIFSKAVRESVGDAGLEGGAEYLISIFEGDLVKVREHGISYRNTKEYLKRREVQSGLFSITTTIGEYELNFKYYAKDSITPEFKGMYQLYLCKTSDKIRGGLCADFMGIYVPNQIEDADKNIPHEYRNAYGTFTVPAGYYLDDSLSTDEKYYFSLEGVALRDMIFTHFNLSFGQSNYGINEQESFRDEMISYLWREKRFQYREPYSISYSGGNTDLEITQEGETAQGYPMLEFTFYQQNTIPVDKFYYIMGDKKYVLVQYSYLSGAMELGDEEKAMIAAAESLVDSFVWAE